MKLGDHIIEINEGSTTKLNILRMKFKKKKVFPLLLAKSKRLHWAINTVGFGSVPKNGFARSLTYFFPTRQIGVFFFFFILQ